MNIKFKKSGFTLVEILVVTAIIAMLTSFVLVSLGESRAYARDANRVSDMAQIQRGLAIYAVAGNRQYPVCSLVSINGTNDCLTVALLGSGSMSKVPIDPLRQTSGVGGPSCGGASTSFIYCYVSDGNTYTLQYHLETNKIKPAGWYSLNP